MKDKERWWYEYFEDDERGLLLIQIMSNIKEVNQLSLIDMTYLTDDRL